MTNRPGLSDEKYAESPGQQGVSGVADDDAVAILLRHHQSHLALCDQLEEIADSLPDNVDVADCRRAIRDLSVRVRLHHRFEEREFFPLLRVRAAADESLQRSLDRLEDEHRTDEGYADEILDLLSAISSGSYKGSPEVAGYMLRGMFESLRRHIAFENDHILPRARRLLTESDNESLLNALARHQSPASSSNRSMSGMVISR